MSQVDQPLASSVAGQARGVIAGDVAAEPASGRPGKPAPSPIPPAPAGMVVPGGLNVWVVVGTAVVLIVVVVVIILIRSTHSGTSSPPTTTSGSPAIVITDNEDVFVGNASPCLGSVMLRLKWAFANVPAGTVVVVQLSGPGLPPTITFTLGPDGAHEQDYQISGSGTWTTRIIDIGNQPPPALHSTNQATATCA